ncbi:MULTISPECIES: phosphoribosyltransferase family protein [unclassified Enterococcus]|uniref:ComF family protein n=1 Tax=unclassified Enterococcus TaxID=2608891 RepID=UPI0013EB1638|nr:MULTISPECIES: phosphoribosyltransferase family protein [unclassified Enterococcus]
MRCNYCKNQLVRQLNILEIIGPSVHKNPVTCQECRQLFQELPEKSGCQGCQKTWAEKKPHESKRGKLEIESMISSYCTDCQEWQKRYPTYDFCHRAFFSYDLAMQEWLNRYKFMGDIRLAGTFSFKWKQLKKEFPRFIICPIPISTRRMAERGFNQVSEMLRCSDVSYQELLVRQKHFDAQAKNTRKERLAMPQPFVLSVDKEKLKNRKILIVDDVYTTGQTLFHAADCLRSCEPAKICTFSLAR